MKILVTGGTGFLGSYIVRDLVKKGYDVIIIKRSYSNIYRIRDIISSMDVFNVDQQPLESLSNYYNNIHVCIHTSTVYSQDLSNSFEVFDGNVNFPLRLLSVLSKLSCSKFINTDTFFTLASERYDYMKSYTLSKKHFKEWGSLVSKEYSIQFINLCLYHVYGPMDGQDKFVTKLIKKLNKGKDIKLTNGLQTRDFIHVNDVVSAYIKVLEHKCTSTMISIDVGTGELTSIHDFVCIAHSASNSKSKLIFGAIPSREFELSNVCADIRYLHDIGWSPKITLEKGIKGII